MAYINKGDMILVRGRHAVATSSDYTKLIFDSYDYELDRAGFEGGSAVGAVNFMYPDTGVTGWARMSDVRKP